jgi:hypothetical protein
MAYLMPSAMETEILNRLAMHTKIGDIHTLEVARRNGVDPQRVPIMPVKHDGEIFVVSARGESDWVRNMRVAGIIRLGQKGNFHTYATTEVPVDERSEVITAYRTKAGHGVNGYWRELPADADHPTFKLTPS